MGTRGIVGFTVDGEDKFAYNHFDSYPDCLGETMVAFINDIKNDIEGAKEKARRIKLVDESRKPSEHDVRKLAEYTDLSVSLGTTEDWYCLLRNTQGDPDAILKCGVIVDYKEFINNSLFCEYAYIVNFDTGMLEMYEGFQKEPHNKGRFANGKPAPNTSSRSYYPCALVGEFPIRSVPDDWKEQAFLKEDE